MKISRTQKKTQLDGRSIIEKNVRTEDFSIALNLANKEHTEHQLDEMLKNIELIGKRLVSTRSLEDAKEYKRNVQEFLTYVVKNSYILKKEQGTFNYGIHTRIEVINKKLDEITQELLHEQKNTIELADKIEAIRGLLIDVYR